MTTVRKIMHSAPTTGGLGGQVVLGGPAQSGAGTFTVPAGVTSISVVVVDGGAAGQPGSAGTVSAPGAGGHGGQGGARRYLNNIAVTPGQVISYTLGGVSGVTSFGSYSGWITALPAGSGVAGANGFTSDAGTNGGGRGGSGGGGASLIDANAVGPGAESTVPSSPNGTNGAAGVWPGGAGGGGGGGCGGRTESGTGFTGSGGQAGAGTAGAIRIVWPGSARQFPSSSTEDWSMGEAGLWEIVRTGSGGGSGVLIYAGSALGWRCGPLTSVDGGDTWVGDSANAYAFSLSPTKLGMAYSGKRYFSPITGGASVVGFSDQEFTPTSIPMGFDNNGSGVWATVDQSTASVKVSSDDGVTVTTTRPVISLTPGALIHLSGSAWLALDALNGRMNRTTDDFATITDLGQPASSFYGSAFYTNSQHMQFAATDKAGVVIVVGWSGSPETARIIRSTDYGVTWAPVAIPAINALLSGVACNRKTGVWVVTGQGGTILRSEDNGMTFQQISSGTTVELRGVAVDDSGNWMASGINGNPIIRSKL